MEKIDANTIDQLILNEKEAFIEKYRRIVESPSISSSSEHKKFIQETAKIAKSFLEELGAEASIIPTDGNPVVFGRLELAPNAPTVAIYNHLDVQPAEEGKDGWTMHPFRLQEKEGRFFSRGTTDDKGPAMSAWWAASMAKKLGLKINIEFIWELEEEIGSPNFEQFIRENKDKIKADNILISDTIWVSDVQPAVSMGLRGLTGVLVRLKTAEKDAHSGLVGGAARNPITELSQLVASCVDKNGDILIPGFKETWSPPSAEELENYAQSGFSIDYFKKAHQLKALRTNEPVEIMQRIWSQPTCEVHGIVGGFQGEGIKTIVPPSAELKMSFRLVPPQDPREIFNLIETHIKSQIPDAEVMPDGFLEPFQAKHDPTLISRVEASFEFGFGKKPVFVREGGSIGAVVTMSKLLAKPIMFMGLSLPEDSYHGPNESFRWSQIQGGVKSFLKYFELSAK